MWLQTLLLFCLAGPLTAHTVEHTVREERATVVTVLFADGEEASYSEWEVFGPGDTSPYALGRTDAHGRLAFLPDRPGRWLARVKADSQHGLHGVNVTVQVGEQGTVKAFSQPVVATHTRLLIGTSLLFGLFGLLNWWRSQNRLKQPR